MLASIGMVATDNFNSLAPGRCGSKFKRVIFELLSWIMFLSTSCEITLRWMPQNTFHGKSILAQVMAWCHQATSHYLSQCWPRSMSQYGITGLLWVKCMLFYEIHFISIRCKMFGRSFLNNVVSIMIYHNDIIIPPPNEVGGGVYWIHLVRPSVRPSVRLSVDDMVSGA